MSVITETAEQVFNLDYREKAMLIKSHAGAISQNSAYDKVSLDDTIERAERVAELARSLRERMPENWS